MIEQDTVKLLRECDAGIKMGVASIEDVLDKVKDPLLKSTLDNCRRAHEKLKTQVRTLLARYRDEGKDADPIAKGMSWMKTNLKLGVDDSDQTVADLMTDGCNMGVKSLNRYLNQYKAASEEAKELAKQLIRLEEQLAIDMRRFL